MSLLDTQRERLLEEFGVPPAFLDALLSLVKQRLGLMSDVRDDYLKPRILASLYTLLKEKAVTIDYNDSNHLLFLVDYTCWEYGNIGVATAMPQHLRARLNELLIKRAGDV